MNTTLEIERDHLLATLLTTLQVRPTLREQIQSVQMDDPYLKKMKEKVEARTTSQFAIADDGALAMED